jgi:hypothetical protein
MIGHQVYLNAASYLQNMVNFVLSLSIRRYPSKFMNVTMCKHCVCDRLLDVADYTTLTPLPLLISCEISFPINLKNTFLKICVILVIPLRKWRHSTSIRPRPLHSTPILFNYFSVVLYLVNTEHEALTSLWNKISLWRNAICFSNNEIASAPGEYQNWWCVGNE